MPRGIDHRSCHAAYSALVKLLVTALIALYCCWQYSRQRVGGYVLLMVGASARALPVIHNIAGLVGSRRGANLTS